MMESNQEIRERVQFCFNKMSNNTREFDRYITDNCYVLPMDDMEAYRSDITQVMKILADAKKAFGCCEDFDSLSENSKPKVDLSNRKDCFVAMSWLQGEIRQYVSDSKDKENSFIQCMLQLRDIYNESLLSAGEESQLAKIWDSLIDTAGHLYNLLDVYEQKLFDSMKDISQSEQ